jgi:hypothetical protein
MLLGLLQRLGVIGIFLILIYTPYQKGRCGRWSGWWTARPNQPWQYGAAGTKATQGGTSIADTLPEMGARPEK